MTGIKRTELDRWLVDLLPDGAPPQVETDTRQGGQAVLKLAVHATDTTEVAERGQHPVVPGQAYCLTAKVRTALGNAHGRLFLQWLDAAGNPLADARWNEGVPEPPAGKPWAEAEGAFDLPVKPGACLVDGVGRQLETFHGDHATVRLSIIPVFVRGLDLARLRLESLPEPVRFAPNTAPMPAERRIWLQAVTRPGVPLNQEFQQKHKLALPVQPGQVERLELRMHNWSDREQSGELVLDLPAGWTCNTVSPIPFSVVAGSCATVRLDLVPGVPRGEALPADTPATVSVRATLRINGCRHDVARVDYWPATKDIERNDKT